MKKQNTRRALLMSALSILLCVSMLVGTTFAWFTDEVKSGKNQIVAGNLDIELEYKKVVDGVATEWVAVKDQDNIFDKNALWEPGRVEVVYLKVSNLGTLALKYQLGVNVYKEIIGLTEDDQPIKLSDHLVFKVVEMPDGLTTYTDREAVKVAAGTEKGLKDYNGDTTALDPKSDDPAVNDEDYLALIVYMPETVGNEANYKTSDDPADPNKYRPHIELGIDLYATQYTAEEDSWGKDYDEGAKIAKPASTLEEVLAELAAGNDVLLANTIEIDTDTVINGYNGTIYRTEEMAAKEIFRVKTGATLTMADITVDGGAKWTGPVDATLQRPITNTGLTANAAIIATEANAHLVLNDGAVIQNNDGANAVNLGTRAGATLTLNGGEIINNNNTGAGAVWGGGNITVNAGKINGNYSTGSAAAIRMVSNCNLTMNGGEMNHNKAAASGGAIWGYGASTYNLSGGEMSYNSAALGGAIYTGDSSTVNVSGTFKMIGNTADDAGAMRLSNRTAFNMSGGEISGNISVNTPEWDGFYGWNPGVNISGGKLEDDIYIQGGLTPTIGKNAITGVVHFVLSTNHNTCNLAAEFDGFKFTVAEGSNFAAFNMKPAAGYTYTAGDEAKLICQNAGYETYWDAANAVFKIRPTGA